MDGKFYLNIGDFMYHETLIFDTEEELRNYVQEKTNGDLTGLDVEAFEIKRVIEF